MNKVKVKGSYYLTLIPIISTALIQVELNSNQNLEILYNGENVTQNLTNAGDDFSNLQVSILRANNSVVTTFPNGASVEVTATSFILNLRLTLPSTFANQAQGLSGNFNDNSTDDFVYPNGTMLSDNATDRMIHDFGQSCKLFRL